MADEDTTGGPEAAAGSSWGVRPTEPPRGRRSGRRRALLATAWTLTGVVLLGGAGLGFVYYKLNGNISGIDINGALGSDRPEDAANGSMDILLMGSDSRAGAGGEYGGDDGTARSDTAMIVHVDEAHERASVVSIPRDTIVRRPSCQKHDGGTAPPARESMFNESYQVGGPVCAVKTVEKMTDVRMDHYLEVDFSGFKSLIDTLGGVEVTVNKPIRDRDSHLNLRPGTHRLDGERSLGLVRTRHSVGDGSDLGRIQLQQAFIRALMEQVDSIGLFGSPKKLFDLADTATSALTTDSELDSVGDLTEMVKTMKGIKADEIRMVTMPVRYDPQNPNRVLPVERQSAQVWAALKKDRPIPKSASRNTAGEESDIGRVVE
ncbi:LCP family protein [Streptomyces sp. N2-109]|uniref:LCP family protein n=1 Tax=Streptomyces gossypii TaxID=2883101 RepID=A0ABT2JYF5_9ACTN|nr:LCP family protein [Streptomyces gossypii]MCT2592375.1 LCP family protein [Streptomyces gossypii]